ncbi:Os12g0112251 [Oryza sativa Japonica Group]|uniref:Os12g0112251 protein n=1 Tax=Oryza sativa subsp. japonica TaxID=39947 RepID=A0A0P0Y6I2_ORYSJ|nr:Os12g0112251 [Oryza sativa Japonica Group]
MDGREKAREATGAATRVRRREPAKRPGREERPREMAPSSRSGSTAKRSKKQEREGSIRYDTYEEEGGGGADERGDLVGEDGHH